MWKQAKTRQDQSLKNRWTHKDKNPGQDKRSEEEYSGLLEEGVSPAVKKTKKKGKLTERLISQGLLTPRMIEELKREIENGET